MFTSRRMSARPRSARERPWQIGHTAETISAASQGVAVAAQLQGSTLAWVIRRECQIHFHAFWIDGGECGEGRATVSVGGAPTAPRLALLLWRNIEKGRAVPERRTRLAMNMIYKETERHEIEALLPWHAAGTLSRRDADRVEQALAADRELARRYDLVRQELAETIHLNETLGAPSPRAMEKLFAAIDAEEVGRPRHRRPGLTRSVTCHESRDSMTETPKT
jgi:hypothetical protein